MQEAAVLADPPPPTATTETDVTPAGATQVYEPTVVYDCDPGGAGVVIELLVALADPVPTEFVAVTVNVYAVPVVNPVTNIGLVVPVVERLPGELVAVYLVIVAPPFDAGAVNAMVADVALVAVAVPIVGAPGTVVGVILLLAELDAPAPTLFVADTVNV